LPRTVGHPQRLQALHGFARPQRAGNAVAEIDDPAGAATPGEIVEHGFEG
jgi:hypothetical protein